MQVVDKFISTASYWFDLIFFLFDMCSLSTSSIHRCLYPVKMIMGAVTSVGRWWQAEPRRGPLRVFACTSLRVAPSSVPRLPAAAVQQWTSASTASCSMATPATATSGRLSKLSSTYSPLARLTVPACEPSRILQGRGKPVKKGICPPFFPGVGGGKENLPEERRNAGLLFGYSWLPLLPFACTLHLGSLISLAVGLFRLHIYSSSADHIGIS